MTDTELFAAQIDRLSRVLLSRVEGHSTSADQQPPRSRIADAFGLSPFELDVLCLVAAAALDADVRRLLAAAGGVRRSAPTVAGLLAVLVREPLERLRCRDAFRAGAPLARHGLIRLAALDELDVEVVPTSRAIAALLGRHPLATLPVWATPSAGAPRVTSWTAIEPAVAARVMTPQAGCGSLCVVRGEAGSGRTTWARIVAHALAPRVVVVDVPHAMATGDDPLDAVFDLVEDCALSRVPIILDDADETEAWPELARRLARACERAVSCTFVVVGASTQLPPKLANRALLDVPLAPPPAPVRRMLWGDLAGAEVIAEELVLGPAQIANARLITERAGVAPTTAAQWQLRGGKDLLLPVRNATRLEDVIVSPEVRDELDEIIGAIRGRGPVLREWGLGARSSRGQGLSALFDGESGTGKTLACDVIAAEVELPLMRVNVATLVDKYIGETEKNLTRVFEQARAHGGILLFDEADALFGQRVEASRAQDRYANLETNLLLQLMEEHSGIVFLTTNLRRNIDQAFMRRITFKVYFDTPDAEHRAQLWARLIPTAHSEPLDVSALAEEYELTGGAIRNAVVRACYRASDEGRQLLLDDLVDCARLEAVAMGKVASW